MMFRLQPDTLKAFLDKTYGRHKFGAAKSGWMDV